MKLDIKNGVLKKCHLKNDEIEVVIPNSVTVIGDSAFEDCSSLKEIAIPDSVTVIGGSAFEGCKSLQEIAIPNNVKSIENSTFQNCSSLRKITIPEGVTAIGSHALANCKSLQEINIPDGVSVICSSTFANCCNLKEISIPNGVNLIDIYAFSGCSSLKKITIPNRVKEIHGYAFRGCNSLQEIIIPDEVQRIGYCAFSGCSSLKEITIPDGVTVIDAGAFYGCSSLQEIIIPEGVKTIGEYTFEGCSNLNEITIPKGVTSIEGLAFKNCSGLTQVTIWGTPAIAKDAFSGCKKIKKIVISADALYQCKDNNIWEVMIQTSSIEDIIKIMKKCPKKLISKAEKRIMESTCKTAVCYFESKNRLDEYALYHGVDADTLRESVLADFGLDEGGCKTYLFAGNSITAKLANNLSVILIDAEGKTLKSVPKKGVDSEEYDRIRKEIAQLKKDISTAVKLHNKRLLSDFLQGRPRSIENWEQSYRKNPLLMQLAKLVVWQQGNKTFILNEEGNPINVHGESITLTGEDILLAHPMEMETELTVQWQEYFLNNHLSQPFAQVWEPVVDEKMINSNRYKGATIPLYMLMNMDVHGITMEGQSKLVLCDCTANLKLISGSKDWINNQFEINNFKFKKYTRAVNHIVILFDKGTVQGRLLKDDVSAAEWLDFFTLAQIMEFIRLVNEKGDCPNTAALLLEYKQKKYPDADPFGEFVLDI